MPGLGIVREDLSRDFWLNDTQTTTAYPTDATRTTYSTEAPKTALPTDAPEAAYATDAPKTAYPTTDAPKTAYPTTDAPKVLPPCPENPPRLVGPLRVEFDWSRTMESVKAELKDILLQHATEKGGRYKPPDCVSRHKVSTLMEGF